MNVNSTLVTTHGHATPFETDFCFSYTSSSTSRTVHDSPPPQRGHRNPSGHRSRTRYARQASSVAKAASISIKFRGQSSTTPAHYLFRLHTTYCGHLSQADTPHLDGGVYTNDRGSRRLNFRFESTPLQFLLTPWCFRRRKF